MGLYDEVKELITNFTLTDIFGKYKPVNSKGKITLRALVRLLTGKPSLGKQDQLINTFKKVMTEKRFNDYKKNKIYPTVFLCSVGFKTGSRKYANCKQLTYEEFLDNVKSTSSIPAFVEPVLMNDEYYYDGGVRDHIGSHWLVEKFNITENYSIFSRPENAMIVEDNWKATNVLKPIFRGFDIMMIEISKNDEEKMDLLSKERGIKNHKIFMPYVLSDGKGMYEFSKETIAKWYDIGKTATHNYMKNPNI